MIEAEVEFNVEFYDVDSMDVVWHGNYVKYCLQNFFFVFRLQKIM